MRSTLIQKRYGRSKDWHKKEGRAYASYDGSD
jgi:hypothetical protein